MVIVHVITAFGIGGAEKLLLNIINNQVEKHEVHLIYLKSKNDLVKQLDKRIIVKKIKLSFFTILNLSKYYKKVNPDVIHTHLGHADILGILAARKLNSKIFTTIHSTFFKKNIIDKFYFLTYRVVFKRIKKVQIIAISNVVKNVVVNEMCNDLSRIHLLPNAIPNKKLKKNRRAEKIKVLFVGRLTKAKSVETLLRAIANLCDENISLTIVGDGELKENLLSLSNDLKLEKTVSFVGEQENIDCFYEESDIFVLPSIWEGFGIVILEAFRAKLAVIASNIEGPSELIKDNINGLLFKPKNHIELAQKMKLLIENLQLRIQLAENGYQTFTNDYHIDTYVEKLEQLYLNA